MSTFSDQPSASTYRIPAIIARPARCPECGHDRNDTRRPKPLSLFNWRVTAPAWAVLACMCVLVVLFARNVKTYQSGSGSPFAYVLEPAFTFDDLRYIADGGTDPKGLAHALLACVERAADSNRWLPGEPVLTVGFSDGRGLRRENLSMGWPTSWYTQIRYALYADAPKHAGFIPIRTQTPNDRSNVVMPANTLVASNASVGEDGFDWPRPRWSWGGYGSGNLAYRPPPEETGGKVVWKDLNAFGLVSILGLIVVAWSIPAVLLWIANVCRGRNRRHWRARWLRWGLPAMVAMVFLWLNFASIKRTDTFVARNVRSTSLLTKSGSSYWMSDAQKHTSLRASQIAGIAEKPEGDQTCARAIIDALQGQPASRGYLSVAITSEALVEKGKTTIYCDQVPLLSLSSFQYLRRPDIGAEELMARDRGVNWSASRSFVTYRWSRGDPTVPERTVTLNLAALGSVAVALWFVWLVTRLFCLFLDSGIARRRRRRNQCIACGHALGPIPSAIRA